MQSLAIKYRPKKWSEVVEQSSTKIILQNQLDTNEIKNAYLFVGSAGTGKTTCARIFASEVNKGKGTPIELDAASNNGVDDVRNIIQQAQTKSIDSEYKVFIIDECHALSNNAWQAFLKLIEEPPAKSIFIFCTTDPQKIPKTIISRVQRFDFQRISQEGIVERLKYIYTNECDAQNSIKRYYAIIEMEEDRIRDTWTIYREFNNGDSQPLYGIQGEFEADRECENLNNELLQNKSFTVKDEALEYIAKIADGGMRDALTLLDKCLAYSKDITIENVIKALGTVNYETMMQLTDALFDGQVMNAIGIIEQMYADGKDLRIFTNQYIQFIIDLCKWLFGCEFELLTLPDTKQLKSWLNELGTVDYYVSLLNKLVDLKTTIKYSATVKYDWECMILLT